MLLRIIINVKNEHKLSWVPRASLCRQDPEAKDAF
jgi:hypothetical protein